MWSDIYQRIEHITHEYQNIVLCTLNVYNFYLSANQIHFLNSSMYFISNKILLLVTFFQVIDKIEMSVK